MADLYDTAYYNNFIKNLYTTSNVYQSVDKSLWTYIENNSSFDTIFSSSEYFKFPSRVVTTLQNTTAINTFLSEDTLRSYFKNGQDVVSTITTMTEPSASPQNNTINVFIQPGPVIPIANIMEKIRTQQSTKVSGTVKSFETYMINHIDALSSLKMVYTLNNLDKDNINETFRLDYMTQAYDNILSLSYSKKLDLYYKVSNQAKVSMSQILVKYADVIRADTISNLKSNFNNVFFLQLRRHIANNLIIPNNIIVELSGEIQNSMKKVLADVYLKSAYPIINYYFISSLQEKYEKKGDYINSRIAFLAKVFFFYYLIVSIKDTYSVVSGTNYDALTTVVTNINNFLTAINDVKIQGVESENIVSSLHNKSNQVVENGKNMSHMRRAIQQNQLGMRNIIEGTDIVHKRFKRIEALYYVVLSFLIALLIACSTLLVLGLGQYVFYVSGAYVVTILFLVVVKIISAFVKKQ